MRSPSVSAELQRADYQRQKERLKQRAEMDCAADARKRCFKCQEEKPLTDFYAHPQMADGRLGKCKSCTKSDVAKRLVEKRPKIREYEAWRFTTENRKTKLRQYVKNQRINSPEKYKARTELGNAVRDGRIKRQPCAVCGDPKSQGHHTDYSKPLDVQWLCFKHHREIGHGQKVGD